MRAKRILTVLMTAMLVAAFSLSMASAEDSAAGFSTSDGEPSSNIHLPYADGYHGSPVNSYLTWYNGDLVRVEYIDGRIIAETYDSSFNVKDRKEIKPELDSFGGFYSGSNAYYVAYGQNNPDESNNVEVFRFVKYDKKWKRIGACSVKGANTTIPFRAGGLAMAEYNGTLYVHTCHQMYTSDDTRRHQANCTFKVRESDMSLINSYYEVKNLSYGYVSHSFEQKVAVDSNYLYRADLGDAHPRAVALTATAHGSAVSSPSRTASIVNIPGSIGDNYTGFDLGGIALSGSSYVVTGCGVTESNAKMNIFISASSKNNLKENVKWITNYDSDSLIDVGTPRILHLKNDQFLLMWEERNTETNAYSTKAMLLASNGSIASSVYSLRFVLSDCEPVVDGNGRVIWYYTDECSPKFVTIDPYRLGEASAQAAEMKEIGLCDIYVGEYGLYYTGKEVRPNVVIDAEEGTLVEGKDYKLTYSDNINAGRASVTITGIGEYSGSIKMFYTIGKASHDIQWDNLGYYVETGAAFNLNAHCDTSDKLTYESEDTSVLTVDADGKVTAVGDGDTYIRIIAGETDNYEKTTRTASFSVSRDYHTMVEDKVIYANGDDNIATIIKKCSVCGKTEEQQITTITSISYLMYYSDGFGISYLSSNLRPGDEFRIGLGGYSPEYPDDTTIVVESSDSSVMSVEDTTVRFVGPGTVTMTVYPKYNPSVKYTRTFTVTDGSSESTDDPYDTGADVGATEKSKTIKAGKIVKKNGSRYTVLSGSKKTVALKKAKNVKSFTVPSTIKIKGYGTFKVVQIKANAFTGNKLRSVTIGKNVSKIRSKAFNKSKVTTITLKTKKLKKANVKGCLKGSKVRTVKVRITKKASSKTNKTYVKKYKKYFTKKNAGRKVRIK